MPTLYLTAKLCRYSEMTKAVAAIAEWSTTVDWAAWSGGLQAVGSIVAIIAAWWLSGLSHRREIRSRRKARKIAAKAIIGNCVQTLKKLDAEAKRNGFSLEAIASFEDETAADAATLAGFPISELDDPELIDQIVRARRLMTTARRRVGFVRLHLKNGEPTIPGYFERPAKSLQSIQSAIEI